MKLNLNDLWRGIRRAVGLISHAFAELEELWGKLPPRLRSELIRYAAWNFGLMFMGDEREFWRWARTQRDETVRGLRDKARYLLFDEQARVARGDGDAD